MNPRFLLCPKARSLGRLSGALFLLSLPLLVAGCNAPHSVLGSAKPQAPSAESAQPLDADGQADLRSILDASTLPDLRWPDFSDYRDDARKFYEAYGYSLPWLQDMQPTPQAQAMIALLQSAADKGLSPEDYDSSRWAERLSLLRPATRDPKESDLVRFDLALTVSAMRYITDLHVGRVNPRHLDFEVDVSQRRYNLPEFLRDDVIHASDLPAILQGVEPPYPGYQRTIQALKSYREMARLDDGELLPATKKPVKSGDVYPGVPRLARLLRLTEDLPKDAVVPADSMAYQGALVDAVKSFQLRNGLTPDGRLDSATLGELNIPLSRRVRQMELTLERWRWLPDEYAHSPIVVNVPEFRLRAYDDQFNIAVTMKVVVGKVFGQHDTPIFMSKMRSVIFRPCWNVPISIVRPEIIPALKRNPGYLMKENMEVTDNRGNVVSSEAVTDGTMQLLSKPCRRDTRTRDRRSSLLRFAARRTRNTTGAHAPCLRGRNSNVDSSPPRRDEEKARPRANGKLLRRESGCRSPVPACEGCSWRRLRCACEGTDCSTACGIRR